jgi:membrane-bound lytic murein transglycosylase A
LSNNDPGGWRLRRQLSIVVVWIILAGGTFARGAPEIHAPPPFFIDDGSRQSLNVALDAQISWLTELDHTQQFALGSTRISSRKLLHTVRSFKELIEADLNPVGLNEALRRSFSLVKSPGRNGSGKMLVTGYYEPLFAGSLTPDGGCRYPLYGLPDDLISIDKGGRRVIGRRTDTGNPAPYWSRSAIETNGLLRGNELVYLCDPFDAYLLHIQGSGRIRLSDGTVKSVRFAGSNGLEYMSLGKLFVDRGIMELSEVSTTAMRDYFSDHPEKLTQMLHHNPRYIFFGFGDEGPPHGSLSIALIAGRSVAVDHTSWPPGIGYLVSRRPVLDGNGAINHWRPFGRFVVVQDSGAAITGPGRVDIFWGNDEYAELSAGIMKEEGELYFLVAKSAEELGDSR